LTTGDKIILPEKYYLDYFKYVLNHVQQLYGDILGPQKNFLNDFSNLSEDAQCLYLRMNGRRGSYFRVEAFNYVEIGHIPNALEELSARGFVRELQTQDSLPEVLSIFTKADLLTFVKSAFEKENSVSIHKSILKQELVTLLSEKVTIEDIAALWNISVQDRLEDVSIIKLLFFGHPYGDFNDFVVRDVGHLKIPNRDNENFSPFFKSRAEIDIALMAYTAYRYFREVEEVITSEELWEWYEPLGGLLASASKVLPQVTNKFTFKVGQLFEKAGKPEWSINAFTQSQTPDAYIRRLKILVKLGEENRAMEYATWLVENGQSAKLKLLGKDYLDKKNAKAKVNSTTTRIKQAQIVEVYYSQSERIEQLVLEHFESQGYVGFFSENYIWRALFGLFFMDELTSTEYEVIHQPLQRRPSDLYSGFLENRKVAVDAKWAKIKSSRSLKSFINKQFDKFTGQESPFIYWHPELGNYLTSFLNWLKFAQLKSVLMKMAENPRENTTGFPDLFVYNDKGYSFYEVKSPNDHLSPQQLFWLNYFDEIGIKVDILRTL
jgi:hypothetical protein